MIKMRRSMRIQKIKITLKIITITIMREVMKRWRESRKSVRKVSRRRIEIINNRSSNLIVGPRAINILSLKSHIDKRVMIRMIIRIRTLMISLRRLVRNSID